MPTETQQTDIVSEARELARTPMEAHQFARRSRELLRQLADEVERLRKQIKTMQREAREDALDAAAEARWQERQGEDYGSY